MLNLIKAFEIDQIFRGIVGHSFENGLRLHRLTERQIAHLDAASEAWGVRARCTAGVRLVVRTDAESVELVGRVLPGARSYAGIDVEVDGKSVAAHRLEAGPETLALSLAGFEEKKIREWDVTFPQSAILEIDALNVPEGTVVEPVDRPSHRLLCLGDSITQGMDALGPASAYPLQLARMLNADLLNQGVGGHIFDADALDPELPYHPNLVTIAYGTNDWGRELTVDEISKQVNAYLRVLLPSVEGADVVVVTPIWRKTGQEVRAGGNLTAFSRVIRDNASGLGVRVVDGLGLVPHRPDLLPDGTHPNDEGFLHYAINLRRALG